ncbi:MAG: sugar phosphate isomerase/epimerase family protein [Candidatus Omnitrophota bacterium]
MIPHDKIYIHMPFNNLINNLDEFCRLKFNCEIYFAADALTTIRGGQIKRINAAFDKNNIKRSIHAPFMDLNPGSYDMEIRQISINRYKQSIDACVKLKAERMVVHTHYSPIFHRGHKEAWLANTASGINSVCDYAAKKSVTIAVENSLDDSSWPTLELLKQVGRLKACFDVAHYNVFSPLGWEAELAQYKPDSILEVHLSDNNGKADEHLPLGEGIIDFKKFLKIIAEKNISPFITIEPHDKEGLYKGLEYIKKLKIKN